MHDIPIKVNVAVKDWCNDAAPGYTHQTLGYEAASQIFYGDFQ